MFAALEGAMDCHRLISEVGYARVLWAAKSVGGPGDPCIGTLIRLRLRASEESKVNDDWRGASLSMPNLELKYYFNSSKVPSSVRRQGEFCLSKKLN